VRDEWQPLVPQTTSHRREAITTCEQRTLPATNVERLYPRSASASSLPRLGLCLSFLACFLFSARFTGGGVPSTVRDAAFTALVALNFLNFFFFGTIAI
jgi:hypothetical protein